MKRYHYPHQKKCQIAVRYISLSQQISDCEKIVHAQWHAVRYFYMLQKKKQPLEKRKLTQIKCVCWPKDDMANTCHLKRITNPTCSKICNGEERSKNLIKFSDNGKGKKRPGTGLKLEKNPAWKGGVTYKRNKGNYIGPKYVADVQQNFWRWQGRTVM